MNTSNMNRFDTPLQSPITATFPITNGTITHRNSSMDNGGTTNFDEVVEQLRRAVVDEIHALRCDVDVLRKGGWKVAVGPFVKGDPMPVEDREGFREDIDKRVGEKLAGVVASLGKFALKKEENDEVDGAISTSKIVERFNPGEVPSMAPWKPAYLRTLAPFTKTNTPHTSSMTTFTWTFLTTLFHGAVEHSPGLYHIPRSAGGCLIPSRTFYAMSSSHEPFIPNKAGEHGAKLTAFFNPTNPEDGGFDTVPLFVSTGQHGVYTYLGNYSQSRWSDKLSYDTISQHIPAGVKQFWAAQLADPARPDWVTNALMKHFFPMPEYEGPMPKSLPEGSATGEEDERLARRVKRKVGEFVEELRLWDEEARTKVGLMKESDMIKAFDKADADENPGLRLWWEYLECKDWDEGFYDMLVREQDKFQARR